MKLVTHTGKRRLDVAVRQRLNMADTLADKIVAIADCDDPEKAKRPSRELWQELVELAQLYMTMYLRR